MRAVHLLLTQEASGAPLSHDRDEVQRSFDRLAARSEPRERRAPRIRLTDDEVRSAIRSLLDKDPCLTAARTLTTLRREHGIACEQHRFAGLYASVR